MLKDSEFVNCDLDSTNTLITSKNNSSLIRNSATENTCSTALCQRNASLCRKYVQSCRYFPGNSSSQDWPDDEVTFGLTHCLCS